jgi:hypothetical protein
MAALLILQGLALFLQNLFAALGISEQENA